MEYLIGIGLALAVCAFALVSGFDRDRAFYPTVAIVVATYYILFAVIGGSTSGFGSALGKETVVALAFAALAVAGFKKNLWLAAAAIAGHGLFDAVHHLFIHNPGMPAYWPGFCMAFDIVAGGWLAVLLMRRK